jgi:serine/threonine-protein kinase
LTALLRIEQLCDRFEAEWKRGRQPDIEEYLAGIPEPERALLRRELLALDQIYRRQMQITLEITAGPHKGRRFLFAQHDTFIVGRSKHAHFRLPTKDKYFSRIHFMVEANPPHCRLIDLGSRNGTYVNGQKVVKADLNNGDQIKAGRTILRVCFHPGEKEARRGASLREVSEFIRPSSPCSIEPDGGGTPEKPRPPAPMFPNLPPVPMKQCRVCSAPIPTALRSAANRQGAPLILLCTACQEEIRNHPQPIPGYQMVRELGRGNMGIVSLAIHEASGTVLALKTITPAAAGSRTQIDRFLRETHILRKLDHPNIVPFRDMGEVNGQFYFAMDYVRGTDAGQLLKSQGPFPIGRAVGQVCQLLDALEYAHDRGFVHRDIKPSNMLVKQVDGQEVVMLADFGLARVYNESIFSGLTMIGEVGGTIAFMPPEQISNFREAKPAADQYGAGATLYKLLTGKFIYDLPPEFEQQLLMIMHKPPVAIQTRRPDIPRDLAIVIHRSLAKNPAKRFPDVKAMQPALSAFMTK